jgi:hypothetical protein
LLGNWNKIAWLLIQILAGLTQSCLTCYCHQLWWLLKKISKELGSNQMTQGSLLLPHSHAGKFNIFIPDEGSLPGC